MNCCKVCRVGVWMPSSMSRMAARLMPARRAASRRVTRSRPARMATTACARGGADSARVRLRRQRLALRRACPCRLLPLVEGSGRGFLDCAMVAIRLVQEGLRWVGLAGVEAVTAGGRCVWQAVLTEGELSDSGGESRRRHADPQMGVLQSYL